MRVSTYTLQTVYTEKSQQSAIPTMDTGQRMLMGDQNLKKSRSLLSAINSTPTIPLPISAREALAYKIHFRTQLSQTPDACLTSRCPASRLSQTCPAASHLSQLRQSVSQHVLTAPPSPPISSRRGRVQGG